jgi:Uma2 family endonuclease
LAVEVVSPYDLAHAVVAKVQEYFRAGVKVVWQVWPNVEQVHAYSSPTAVRILTRGDELTGAPVIPGFRMALADLFPAPAPNP